MEAGHPELHSYDFCAAELYLTKLWVEDDPEHTFVQAEFLLAANCKHREASQDLLQLMESDDFERPELLAHQVLKSGHARDIVFYLTHLPRKGWNHGDEVTAMLERLHERRPADLGQRLARWVLEREQPGALQKGPRSGTYRRQLALELTPRPATRFDAQMIAVTWQVGEFGEPGTPELYLLTLDLA